MCLGSSTQTFEAVTATNMFQLNLGAFKAGTGACGSVGTMVIVSLWYGIPQNDPVISSLALFDNASASNHFYSFIQTNTMLSCRSGVTGVGTCPAAGLYQTLMLTFYSTITIAAGHVALTLESQRATFPYVTVVAGSILFVQGLASNTARASCGTGFYYTASTNTYPNGFPVGGGGFCDAYAPAFGFTYGFILYTQNPNFNAVIVSQVGQVVSAATSSAVQTDRNHCTNNSGTGPICFFATGWGINGNFQDAFQYGIACTSLCTETSGVSVAISFGPACTNPSLCVIGSSGGGTGTGGNGGSTSGTGPSNTSCNPACTGNSTCSTPSCISGGGTSTGSGNYTNSNSLYYYVAHNSGSGGTIYNFTTKIAQDHCKKSTCYLYQAIYVPATPTSPPSSSNKLLLYSPVVVYGFANSSTNLVLSAQLSINVPAGDYWADAVASNSTASGSSGATGSGVSIYAATWTAPMDFYGLPSGSSLMPLSFIGTLYTSFPLYFKAALVTGQASSIVTTTSVESLSVSTFFTTSTFSNPINSPPAQASGNILVPTFTIMLPLGFFGAMAVIMRRIRPT